MHTRSMSELEGEFQGDWKLSPKPCPHCGVTGQRYYRFWNSECGGYVDEKDECRACGRIWWIDGPDA